MPPGMLVCGAVTDAENHLDQAIRACDEALSLDGDCVKALQESAHVRPLIVI